MWGAVICALQDSSITPKEMLRMGGAPEGITNDRISQYKNGSIFPEFAHLPWLSQAIGKRPSYLAELLGAVPDTGHMLEEHVEALRRFESLTKDIASMERRLQENSDSQMTKIVSAALATGHWAVAVWPASEGPDDCKVHVSDRLDFRRTDGGEESAAALQRDLGGLIPSAAILKTPPGPRWSETPIPGLALSLQPKLDFRSPGVPFPHPLMRSVAVVSHTVQSWASDVASILATFLGYGLESTRDLKVRIHGGPRHPGADKSGGEEVSRLRAEIHENFLHTPPRRYVWYHFGEGVGNNGYLPGIDAHGSWPFATLVVRLRESDDLLDVASKNNQNPTVRLEHLYQVRKSTDVLMNLHQTNLLYEIQVDAPDKGLAQNDMRNWKRTQALENAASIVEYALGAKLLHPTRMEKILEDTLDRGTRDERVMIAWAKKNQRLTYGP